jgi:response regulator of citrate/malate metabolism
MKILIIEDEQIASSQLAHYIGQYNADFEIVGILRSIKEAMIWCLPKT